MACRFQGDLHAAWLGRGGAQPALAAKGRCDRLVYGAQGFRASDAARPMGLPLLLPFVYRGSPSSFSPLMFSRRRTIAGRASCSEVLAEFLSRPLGLATFALAADVDLEYGIMGAQSCGRFQTCDATRASAMTYVRHGFRLPGSSSTPPPKQPRGSFLTSVYKMAHSRAPLMCHTISAAVRLLRHRGSRSCLRRCLC